jgi:hypothetical protein
LFCAVTAADVWKFRSAGFALGTGVRGDVFPLIGEEDARAAYRADSPMAALTAVVPAKLDMF